MRGARWVFAVALLLTVLVYWTGLYGPFVLDDTNNLTPILEWLRGDNDGWHVLFGNRSGMFGRPLSMATLMLSAWLGGYEPFAFKLGNLIVHLLCGFAGWQMLRRALALDPRLRGQADMIAALLTAAWLLHPINVSTVLYSVQRMAQISTLFTLVALWAYLSARNALEQGRTRRATCGLFGLFPLLLIAGLLGKENAAVAPALCLVFELAYFQRTREQPRSIQAQRMLAGFFGAFLIVPSALTTIFFAIHPGRFLVGYAIRDFTLSDRLLSEGRAVLDYLSALLLPRGSAMGIFNDDFVVSTGLWSPPSTAFALLALVAISALAIALRKRAPSVFAGWFFFLVAHSIESTIFPLELYFEHRNYLPALGLLLALAGMTELLTRRIGSARTSRWKFGLLAAGAYGLALGAVTLARAYAWADEGRLLSQEAAHRPDSERANIALAFYSIRHGNVKFARATIDGLLQNPNPRVRELTYLNRVLADCVVAGTAATNDLREAVALARPIITLDEMYVLTDLASINDQRSCIGADPTTLADTIVAMLTAARNQPDGVQPKWRLRLMAAQLYATVGDWKQAVPQAELGWQPTADAPVGAFLARVYVHNGMREDAERTFAEVADRINGNDAADRNGLEELRHFLDQAATGSGKTIPPD